MRCSRRSPSAGWARRRRWPPRWHILRRPPADMSPAACCTSTAGCICRKIRALLWPEGAPEAAPIRSEVMENVEQRVRKIIAEQLGVNEAEIKNESSFVDDLGADSLDTVELVMALEEEFNTEIPDEEAEKITTVSQAVEYIKAHGKS